jgi:hypothetical protein
MRRAQVQEKIEPTLVEVLNNATKAVEAAVVVPINEAEFYGKPQAPQMPTEGLLAHNVKLLDAIEQLRTEARGSYETFDKWCSDAVETIKAEVNAEAERLSRYMDKMAQIKKLIAQ